MKSASKYEDSKNLKASLADVSAVVLVGYDGLTVQQSEALRTKMREAGCSFRAYKNSSVHYAVEGTKHQSLQSLLVGTTGLAYHAEDPGAPARVARDFAKENDKFSIKGGIMDGQVLDPAGVDRLASMPGPRELKSMLLNVFMAPATKFVRLLNTPGQGLLTVLNAKREKDEAA